MTTAAVQTIGTAATTTTTKTVTYKTLLNPNAINRLVSIMNGQSISMIIRNQ